MATVNVRLIELMTEKSKRDGRNITQQIVAEAIGVPQSTLSRWVGNKVDRLDKDIMTKLCLYFDCEIGDLLVFERDPV